MVDAAPSADANQSMQAALSPQLAPGERVDWPRPELARFCADDHAPDQAAAAEADQAEGAPFASGSRQRPPRYLVENFIVASLGGRRSTSELEQLLVCFWVPAAVFATAEVGAFLGLRKSFFVALTDGAFEAGRRYGTVVEIHVWASVSMWAMAAVQVWGEQLRKRPETAWIHRRTGQIFLLLFFSVIFPTSLYLSALQRIDHFAPAVAAVLLDTAFCTMYFLFRGWRVARLRSTPRSLSLHGKLMQCGVMMSMSILPQRLLQFYLTMQVKGHYQMNYSLSILVTSILFVLFGHFKDGARGGIWLNCIGTENAEEAFGSLRASAPERWAWRLRWLAYVLVYYTLRRLLS